MYYLKPEITHKNILKNQCLKLKNFFKCIIKKFTTITFRKK